MTGKEHPKVTTSNIVQPLTEAQIIAKAPEMYALLQTAIEHLTALRSGIILRVYDDAGDLINDADEYQENQHYLAARGWLDDGKTAEILSKFIKQAEELLTAGDDKKANAMTSKWAVTVGLARPAEGERTLSPDEQRELLRQLAHLDPQPVDCTFHDSDCDSYVVAKILFVTEAPTRFEAQTHADAIIDKLKEALTAVKLRVRWFSVEEKSA